MLWPAPLHEMNINNFCSCIQNGISSVQYPDTAPAEDKTGVQKIWGIISKSTNVFNNVSNPT